MDSPRAVAEVTAELAHDRGRRIDPELQVPAGIEPVDRLQQADPSLLDEIVERLATVGEAARTTGREPLCPGRNLVSESLVARDTE